MSLDVYLYGEEVERECECPNCYNIHKEKYSEEYYSAKITHNLNNMADEAGIYKAVWRPEEIGIEKASQLITPLKKAISLMKAYPNRFKKHNSKNGWGLYQHFLPWLKDYLAACEEYPESRIKVSR